MGRAGGVEWIFLELQLLLYEAAERLALELAEQLPGGAGGQDCLAGHVEHLEPRPLEQPAQLSRRERVQLELLGLVAGYPARPAGPQQRLQPGEIAALHIRPRRR